MKLKAQTRAAKEVMEAEARQGVGVDFLGDVSCFFFPLFPDISTIFVLFQVVAVAQFFSNKAGF